jgi:RNA polymerase sigma factor (sigma-70 family)
MNDWALLHEYIERRSESAFEMLVRRHIDMVYSVALRQLRDAHLAEDVTQAVFILLARKAPRLSSSVVIAGWLHRTAWLVARRAWRDEARRQRREREVADMNDTVSTDELWARLAPQLDGALGQIDDADRNVIVLRFLEQRSFRDVAEALGVSEEAAKKRSARALEKLRVVMVRRGIAASIVGLTAATGAHALQAAPAALLGTSAAAGISRGASATSTAAALVTATLRQMLLRRAAWAGALGLIALLLSGTWRQFHGRSSAVTTATAEVPALIVTNAIVQPSASSNCHECHCPASTAKRGRGGSTQSICAETAHRRRRVRGANSRGGNSRLLYSPVIFRLPSRRGRD